MYREMGYRILATSAITGEGVSDLRAELVGKLTVGVGLSGTGKSSLMSAVQPGLDLRIGEISQSHHQGRHTTTQAEMYRLDGGGYVADTPGIREFGLAGRKARGTSPVLPGDRRTRSGVPFQQLRSPRRTEVRGQDR